MDGQAPHPKSLRWEVKAVPDVLYCAGLHLVLSAKKVRDVRLAMVKTARTVMT